MKTVVRLVAKILGIAFMVAAFLQWITFDYPDVNVFRLGATFAPGIFSQFVNSILVCILAVVGWALFMYGSVKVDKPHTIRSQVNK